MDLQECKVFFDVNTTKQEAQEIISKYCSSIIDTFQEKREIGANVVTFAVVTIPVKASAKMVEVKSIKRVDVITAFRSVRSTGCDGGG